MNTRKTSSLPFALLVSLSIFAASFLFTSARAVNAGVEVIGNTAYPNGGMFELPKIKLSNEDNITCGIASTSATVAWFGTNTTPGQIIKVNLLPLERAGLLVLPDGENSVTCAAIDKANQFGYFGLATDPPKIIKVNLQNMTRVGSLSLAAGEGPLGCGIVNAANNTLYLGTNTTPAKVIRINLTTFQRTGTIDLPATDSSLKSVALSTNGQFAYFGTFQANARVVKINLSTFTRVTSLAIAGLNNICTVASEPTGNFLYACGTATNGRLVRLDLATFAVDGTLDLLAGEGPATAMAVNQAATEGTICCAGRIVAINLATFMRITWGGLDPSYFTSPPCAFYPPGQADAWAAGSLSPAVVAQFKMVIGPGAMLVYAPVATLFLEGGQNNYKHAVMSADGTRIFWGSRNSGPSILEFDTTRQQPVRGFGYNSSGIRLAGEIKGIGLNQFESFLYALSAESDPAAEDGRFVRLNLSTYAPDAKFDLPGEVKCVAFDPGSNYAYVASRPAVTVQADRFTLEPFALPANSTQSFSIVEGSPVSALAFPGSHVDFGTNKSPAGMLRPNFGTGYISQEFSAGLNNCSTLISKFSEPTQAYAGFSDLPSTIKRIDLQPNPSLFTPGSSLLLNTPGKRVNLVSYAAMDPLDRFALYVSEDDRKIARHDLNTFINYDVLSTAVVPQSAVLTPEGDEAFIGLGAADGPHLGHLALTTRDQIHATKINLPTKGEINTVRFYAQSGVTPRRKLLDRLSAGEDFLVSGAIDRTRGKAYFGTVQVPGRVIAYDLNTRQRLASNVLNNGDEDLECCVIDSTGTNLYFGTFTFPARVVRVRASDLQRTGGLDLPGDNNLIAAAIDPTNTFAYFACAESPARIVKVRLSDMTKVGSTLSLNDTEEQPKEMLIDPAGQFLYVLCGTSPGKIVKVRLSDFTRVGVVTFEPDETAPTSMAMDSTYLYASCQTDPGKVVGVLLSSFARDMVINLNPGSEYPQRIALSPDKKFLTVLSASNPPRVSTIDLDLQIFHDSGPLREAEIASTPLLVDNNGLAWAGVNSRPGRVMAVEPQPKPLRLAIYRELNGQRQLVWQAGPLAITNPFDFMNIPISSGSPAALTLSKGTYWLAWQCDASERVPSYLPGGTAAGFSAYHSFGAFPSQIPSTGTGAYTDTTERWTGYLTYQDRNTVEDFSVWE